MKRLRLGAVSANAGALIVVQLFTYALPLAAAPYLTRVLGAHDYGVVAYGLSLLTIANLITDFGFNLSATYRVATGREDHAMICRLGGAVTAAKACLAILVSLLYLAYVLTAGKYEAYRAYLAWIVLSIIAQAFLPVWFFQGIEKMGSIAAFSVVARAGYLLSIFLFVHDARDMSRISIGGGVSWALASLYGFWLVRRKGYHFTRPSVLHVWESLRDSAGFFWSRAAMSTYTAGGAVFLGLASSPTQVAYYSAAQQLYLGAQSLLNPVVQALFPHVSRHRNLKMLLSAVKWFSLLSLIGLILGILVGKRFLVAFYGQQFSASYPVLVVFLFVFLLTAPSMLLGYPLFGALGHPEKANRSIFAGGAVQIVCLTMFYAFGYTNAAETVFSVVLVELVVIALRVWLGRKMYKTAQSDNPASDIGARVPDSLYDVKSDGVTGECH